MPAVGDILAGRYRIDARIGAGGMATVYRAHDLRLERDVAVKVLLPNMADDSVIAERFDREARALASVRHPNVVAVHDVDPGDAATGREPFFVMEMCEGGSLADRLAAADPLGPGEIVPIIVAAADGLAELHANGIVHRDIKPHNILLAATGAKLADFGVARTDRPEDDALTTVGSTVGTLAYLAPEQLSGEPATPASDGYGLGVVAYQSLSGRLPRAARTWAELADARRTPIAPLSEVRPDLGTAFDEPLAGALADDPADRPDLHAFAAGLASALGRWSRSRPAGRTAATPPLGRTPATPPPALPPPDVGDEAPTVVSVPARPSEPESVRRGDRGQLLFAAVVGTLAGLILLAVLFGRPTDDPTGALPSATLPGAGSTSPSPAPSPSPSPSPPPATPVPDAVQAALTGMRTAIEAATGGNDGLRGKDARELLNRVDDIERRTADSEGEEARRGADELVKKIEELIDKRDLGGPPADDLLAAAQVLQAALPGED